MATRKPVKKKVKLSSLIEDFGLYPRNHVNFVNIRELEYAIEAGKELPCPIVTPEGIIVDGVNRCRAWRHHFADSGEKDGDILVEVRTYANRADLLEDAIALNVGRGADLTPYDKIHCIGLADEVGLSREVLADRLSMTPARLELVQRGRFAKANRGRAVPIKRKIQHMAEQMLTAAQEEANERLTGTPATFDIEQLTTMLETDLMPYTNKHVELLQELHASLTTWLQLHPLMEEGESNVG